MVVSLAVVVTPGARRVRRNAEDPGRMTARPSWGVGRTEAWLWPACPLASAPRLLLCLARGLAWLPCSGACTGLGGYFHRTRLPHSRCPLVGPVASRATRERCLLTPPLPVYSCGTDETKAVVGPGWPPHKDSFQPFAAGKRDRSGVRYRAKSGPDLVQDERDADRQT